MADTYNDKVGDAPTAHREAFPPSAPTPTDPPPRHASVAPDECGVAAAGAVEQEQQRALHAKRREATRNAAALPGTKEEEEFKVVPCVKTEAEAGDNAPVAGGATVDHYASLRNLPPGTRVEVCFSTDAAATAPMVRRRDDMTPVRRMQDIRRARGALSLQTTTVKVGIHTLSPNTQIFSVSELAAGAAKSVSYRLHATSNHYVRDVRARNAAAVAAAARVDSDLDDFLELFPPP